MKIGIIIPGYRVESSIEKTILSLSAQSRRQVAEILVIDNASEDATIQKLREMRKRDSSLAHMITVIRNKRNYGLGGSLKIGFQYYLQRADVSHIMILHSDDQGNSDLIARRFLECYAANPDADMILASRFHRDADISSYSKLRRIGNIYFNILTWLLTGQRMSDAGSGIILMKTDILRHVAYEVLTDSFYFNPQLNILLYANPAIRIVEVPLDWADSEHGSHLRAMRYIRDLTKTLLSYRWNIIQGKPGFGAHADAAWIARYPFDFVEEP